VRANTDLATVSRLRIFEPVLPCCCGVAVHPGGEGGGSRGVRFHILCFPLHITDTESTGQPAKRGGPPRLPDSTKIRVTVCLLSRTIPTKNTLHISGSPLSVYQGQQDKPCRHHTHKTRNVWIKSGNITSFRKELASMLGFRVHMGR